MNCKGKRVKKLCDRESKPRAVLDLEILRRDQTQFRASRGMSAFGKSRRYKTVAAMPALDPFSDLSHRFDTRTYQP